jgi:hypothetical protein
LTKINSRNSQECRKINNSKQQHIFTKPIIKIVNTLDISPHSPHSKADFILKLIKLTILGKVIVKILSKYILKRSVVEEEE